MGSPMQFPTHADPFGLTYGAPGITVPLPPTRTKLTKKARKRIHRTVKKMGIRDPAARKAARRSLKDQALQDKDRRRARRTTRRRIKKLNTKRTKQRNQHMLQVVDPRQYRRVMAQGQDSLGGRYGLGQYLNPPTAGPTDPILPHGFAPVYDPTPFLGNYAFNEPIVGNVDQLARAILAGNNPQNPQSAITPFIGGKY